MWGNVQEQQTQTMVLQQPKDQKVYLEVQHSTDWVVVITVFVSGLISLFGFIVTVYVVKKSTESQIKSNKDLIKSQNEIKVEELKTLYKQRRVENLRVLISEISLQGMSLLSWAKFRYMNSKFIENSNIDISIEDYHQFQNSITKVIFYIRPGEKQDEQIRKELFELLESSRKIIMSIIENKDYFDQMEVFENKLGYTQASLNRDCKLNCVIA
jgi:uncharacterized protein YneF (UPF0154 family)